MSESDGVPQSDPDSASVNRLARQRHRAAIVLSDFVGALS